jgi:putative endonuclease
VVRAKTRVVGSHAEDLALQFLQQKGLTAVQRNFQCRLGELDLIMRDHDCLVIVEVRYRSSRSLVPAGQTIDRRKQEKLIRTTALFLAWNERFANRPLRFDVVGIDADSCDEISIEWIRDAFRPADNAL